MKQIRHNRRKSVFPSYSIIRSGVVFSALALLLSACGAQNKSSQAEPMIKSTLQYKQCSNFTERFIENVYNSLAEGKELPQSQDLQPYIEELVKERFPDTTKENREELIGEFSKAYLAFHHVIVKNKHNGLDPETKRTYVGRLAALVAGDVSSPNMVKWQAEYQIAKKKLEASLKPLDTNCQNFITDSSGSDVNTPQPDDYSRFAYSDDELKRLGESTKDTDPNAKAKTQISQDWQAPASTNSNPGSGKSSTTQPVVGPATSTTNSTGTQYLFKLMQEKISQRQLNPSVAGARLTMGTGYQSCNTLEKPRMGLNEVLRGLVYYATHQSGATGLWKIFDLPALIQSHFYLRDLKQPESDSCLDTKKFPLLYDYGGRPGSKVVNGHRVMDLFTNAGSGSNKIFGLDCTGFVATALLTAGLKISKSNSCNPEEAQSLHTRLLFNEKSRPSYNCLDQVEVSQHKDSQGKPTAEFALLPGDLIVTNGIHIAMVDQVGKDSKGRLDPFGLEKITQQTQCEANSRQFQKFNFSVIQSSANSSQRNAKYGGSGIGMNRMTAKDYFTGDTNMRAGVIKMALAACLRKFGAGAKVNGDYYRFYRHRSYDSNCICPKRVNMYREQCMQVCPVSAKAVQQ